MNVIFLDFNGVLDTYDNFDIIDISNLHILIDAINLTNSKVVITSSNKDYFYRNGRHNNIMNNLINVLKSYNVCVLGYTKKLNSREEEIIEYLCSHPEIEHYCIIDENFVATDIFTKEQFYILKKDITNRILASEKDKIVMNKTYGIHYKKINLLYLPELEQKKLLDAYSNLKKSKQNIKKR